LTLIFMINKHGSYVSCSDCSLLSHGQLTALLPSSALHLHLYQSNLTLQNGSLVPQDAVDYNHRLTKHCQRQRPRPSAL